jgi:hypothetical protein
LSIVRISKNQKIQRFRNWIYFRLQARGGGTYSTEKPKARLSTGDARTKELILFWHRLWKGKFLVFL